MNVIANAQFGTVVSESGSVYTWSENSHEFRLTPWYNDPVTDMSGEAIYVRDEETGRFWSPSPLPARGENPYVARHGFGYSIFENAEDGIVTELCLFVATDAPVKFVRLKITNRSGRPRQLSVTGYWEWVLGELRNKALLHVATDLDPISGALFTRNIYSPEFSERVVFVHSSETARTVTADRTEFLGRNGTPANPAALRRTRLSGRVGAGLDPARPCRSRSPWMTGRNEMSSSSSGPPKMKIRRGSSFTGFAAWKSCPQQAPCGRGHSLRSRCLGCSTWRLPTRPSTSWPTAGSSIKSWPMRNVGGTGLLSIGGAFGFRDQLQDAMALVHAEPGLLREHLLRAAAHQFREGDVQHWWHPPGGRGVRTHFSDDFLWLPYATYRYVAATGDVGVLDERVPFLTGRLVRPEEDAYYDLPQISDDVGTLYEHCVRAVDNGLRFGAHGLPLMGGGDWNDGMNLVGIGGKGESVWLAFFLFDVPAGCSPTWPVGRGDAVADNTLREYRTAPCQHPGTRLGRLVVSASLFRRRHATGVVHESGVPDRRLAAKLVGPLRRRHARALPDLPGKRRPPPGPPRRPADPGSRATVRQIDSESRLYQGLCPRRSCENGGQYTHAAAWTVMAFAALGDVKKAWELFNLINPVTHATTPDAVALYRVEPYVVAADVYGNPPHTGRGGWTWYTGSAGWMYRLITESLLGVRLEVDKLRFTPCLPSGWSSFKIHYRYRETNYHITIRNSGAGLTVTRIVVDGKEQPEKLIPLVDDRNHHNVEMDVG